jgi:hypothetical protein
VDYVEDSYGQLHIVDLNPRLQGSTTLLTALENNAVASVTLAAHLASFLVGTPQTKLLSTFSTQHEHIRGTLFSKRCSYVQIVILNNTSGSVATENGKCSDLILHNNKVLCYPPLDTIVQYLDSGAIALFDCPMAELPVRPGAMLCRAWFGIPANGSKTFRPIELTIATIKQRVMTFLKVKKTSSVASKLIGA